MVDIELVKDVLRRATAPGAGFSQRGLSAAAKLDRDAVYDILNDRNKNPTIATLASIAEQLGGDLSMFGLARVFVLSEERLRDELATALPHAPKRATHAERAEYLAEAVADALGLPKTEQEALHSPPEPHGRPEADEAPAFPRD